jgi:replicative DNA helicase
VKGKEPPHSLESESCLLGSMILDNSIIPKVLAQTSETSFYIESYKLLWRGIADTYQKRKAVDLVLLKDTMNQDALARAGGSEKLVSVVAELPNANNWESYLKTVSEKEELRRYLQSASAITEAVYSGSDIDTIRGLSRAGAKQDYAALRSTTIWDASRTALSAIDTQRSNGPDLSTGLRDIDELLGGLRRKEMTVVGAKMSNGKTSVAMNIKSHALLHSETQKVLINVFENPDQVPTRTAAIISGLPLEWFVKPHTISNDQYDQVKAALALLEAFKDRVLVMNSASLMDMRGACDVFKPDIIILDYLQKYAQRYCADSGDTYAHAVGRVASEVQELAKDFNAHSLLFSQLARRMNGERNRPPEVPDLKESGDIENCADNVLLCWWPWRDVAAEGGGGKDPRDYYIIVAKNKLGPVDKKIVRINPANLAITSYGGGK